MDNTLTPIEPEEAVATYLQSRTDLSEKTQYSHRSRLGHFVRWCESEQLGNVQNLNKLTGRDLYEYRIWRREEGDLKPVTVRTQLSTVKVFIQFCESIDAVRDGLSEKIIKPTVEYDDQSRDVTLDKSHFDAIQQRLQKYEYAGRTHVIIELLWAAGMRVGELRAIDVGDVDRENNRLTVEHRPVGGTPLKNGYGGERIITLPARIMELLTDYIDRNRPAYTDDNDRRPLLCGTSHSRISVQTIRRIIYAITEPCRVTECPLSKDPDECAYHQSNGKKRCPEALSPHDIRRGSITYALKNDVPEKVVGDRMDVSSNVLEKHYDKRSEEDKAEQRREFMEYLE
jgi:site-specific recombinase XerD